MAEHIEQRLGNYYLNRLIGTSAFADVYLGTHIYLSTPVAIKVPRGRLKEQALESFLIGARDLTHLVHPHINRVFDVGSEHDTPFLVMAYAPNGNWRQRHPLGSTVPLAHVLASVTPIASALQHAHDQHVVHLDLKPENLLQGSNHEILVSDFGLASLASLAVQPRLGTMVYVAPEQIQGQAGPASDQYALAIMMYEWLSGQPPFEGTAAELINQHLVSPPTALREQHPEVPPAVEQVIFTALAKDPARRYVDVLTFASAFAEACQTVSPFSSLSAMPTETSMQTGEARSVLRGSRADARHLPVPLMPLIGRTHALQTARARLLHPEVRLLTFTGTPGVGKTRLALALAGEVREEFAQDVCFVGLAAISEPDLLVPTIRDALGLQESLELSPFEHLVAYLREKQLLLVLDNFEHLLPAASRLADLLAACPPLKILVTSRATLHLQGEYEFIVPPLALPDLQQLPGEKDLSQVEAVALFLQRTVAINLDFKLTPNNAAAIAAICVRLEGVPLAIELAAARIKLFSPQVLLARLAGGFAVLSSGKQDAPSHQRTLRSTVAWSYEHLTTEEQALFRRLAVFAGTFSLEAAEAVVPVPGDVTVLAGIAALIDHSLLKQQAEGPELRLYLVAFIREYALECLGASDELEQARDAHARYYLALAERAEPALVGAAQAVWLARLEREVENIRAALQWLLERHEYDAALRLPAALRQFWVRWGLMSEGRDLLEQALEASREDDGEHHTQLRAQALQAAGFLAYRLGDLEHAPVYLETSLRIFQQLEDKLGIAVSLHFLGTITYVRGEVKAGWAMIQQGLARSREIGAKSTSAEILLYLGVAALFRGEYGQAQKLLAESQTLYTAGEDVWGSACALHYLGMVAFAQGDSTRARSLSEQSLASFRKLGMPWPATEVLALLAREALALGEEDEASALLEEALSLARKRANTEEVVRVLCGLGQLAWRQGNLAEARALCEEGVTRMQGRTVMPRMKWVVASCLEGLGAIAMAQGEAAWTVQLFAAAATARAVHGHYSSLGIEQSAYERTLAEARAQLGEKVYAAAWAAGKHMTPQQALIAPAPTPLDEQVNARRAAMSQSQPASVIPTGLTARESEVLRLLARGLSNKQIAEQLVLSPFTVGTHVETIYGKLGVSSRSAATRFAVEHHLV